MPESGPAAAAIAGACMGAVHGIGVIEKLLPAGAEWTLDKEKEQGTRMWAVGAERIKKNVIRRNGLG
jgi:hypothetical protein